MTTDGILRHLVPINQTTAHKVAVATNQSTAEGIAERSPLSPLPKLVPTAVSTAVFGLLFGLPVGSWLAPEAGWLLEAWFSKARFSEARFSEVGFSDA